MLLICGSVTPNSEIRHLKCLLCVFKGDLKRNIINLSCIRSLLNQFLLSKGLLFFFIWIFKVWERSLRDVTRPPLFHQQQHRTHDVTKAPHSNLKNLYKINGRPFESENWFSRLLIHARFIIFLFRSPLKIELLFVMKCHDELVFYFWNIGMRQTEARTAR